MRVHKDYTLRDVRKIMRLNGYTTDHYTGGHQIFTDGHNNITIPSHTSGHKCVNRYMFDDIVKEYDLKLTV